MANKKFEVAGNVSIISTGQSTVHKEEFEKVVDRATVDAGEGTTLTDMYDRFSKLLYVIDSSGSMGEGMLSDDSLKLYKWTPEILEQFRVAMEADDTLVEEEPEQFDEDEEFLEESEEEDPEQILEHIDVRAMSDNEIKMAVIRDRLDSKYNIHLEMNYSARLKSRSKMMALKDAAKEFVHIRFMRFKDARVGVFSFEDRPKLLCAAGASEEEVMNGIERLPDFGGGGTNIYAAVEQVVNECKKRPSEVGLHHIVLVSDGCDGGGVRVRDLVPKMKELGIVFDFIYMVGVSGDNQGEAVARVMQEVCEATGGEYTVVKTEKDFEQKFLAVSSRLMLPAPKK